MYYHDGSGSWHSPCILGDTSVRSDLLLALRVIQLRPRSPDPTVIILLKYIGIVKIGMKESYYSFIFSGDSETIRGREDSHISSDP